MALAWDDLEQLELSWEDIDELDFTWDDLENLSIDELISRIKQKLPGIYKLPDENISTTAISSLMDAALDGVDGLKFQHPANKQWTYQEIKAFLSEISDWIKIASSVIQLIYIVLNTIVK